MVFLLVLLPFTFIEFFYEPWMNAQATARTPRQLPPDTRGHVLLTNYDSVASALIPRLEQYKYPYALVVPDLEDALHLHDLGLNVVLGDLDDPETWSRVRVENATLVASTSSDFTNTNVAFTVRGLAKEVPIITSADDEASVDILKLAGSSFVLRLPQLTGQSFARRTLGGDAKSHVIGKFDKLRIAEATAHRTPLVGKTIRESRLRETLGVTVVGVWERGRFEAARAETEIHENTVLVLAGSKQDLLRYNEFFCIYNVSTEPVLILGGGRVGRATANHKDDGDVTDSLGEFLGQSPPPPHSALLNTIRNAVGKENACCFPVSAFGAHTIRDDGKEVPLLDDGRLQSFALEDGFVWVAKQCDALRVEQIEAAADATSWWAFPQMLLGTNDATLATESSAWTRWFRGVSAIAGVSSAWGFRQRLPKGSELRRRTTSALRAFGLKLASQVVVFVVLLMTLLIGGETIIDGVQYRTIVATEKNPSANVEEIKRGEDWLVSYFRSPSFRHVLSNRIVVGRSDAHRILVEFRTRRDETLWQTVVDAEDPQTRVILARKYLDVFPSGLHRSEADTLVADADRREWERKNNEYLDQIAIKIDAVEPKPDAPLESLHVLSEEVDAIPYPEARSPLTNNQQEELRGLIAEKQTKIVEASKQADWQRFKQTYVSLMQSKNIPEAAKLLDGRQPRDAQLQELADDFTKQAPAIIQAKVRDALKNRSWQLARESARIIADPNVVRLFPVDTIKALQGLGREIDEAEDRDLYAQIVRYKPQCADQLDAYLQRAPLKSMELEVQKYRQYAQAMKEPLDLTLNLTRINWHKDFWAWRVGYYNDVTVLVKGNSLIAKSGIKSKPNTSSGQVGDGEFKSKLNETITIDVSIVTKYTGKLLVTTASMPGGSGTWTGTPNQLRSGVTINLNGDGFTNKAVFSLTGLPKEPLLPGWKKQ